MVDETQAHEVVQSRVVSYASALAQLEPLAMEANLVELTACTALSLLAASRLAGEMARRARRMIAESQGQAVMLDKAANNASKVAKDIVAVSNGALGWLDMISKDMGRACRALGREGADAAGWRRLVQPVGRL